MAIQVCTYFTLTFQTFSENLQIVIKMGHNYTKAYFFTGENTMQNIYIYFYVCVNISIQKYRKTKLLTFYYTCKMQKLLPEYSVMLL